MTKTTALAAAVAAAALAATASGCALPTTEGEPTSTTTSGTNRPDPTPPSSEEDTSATEAPVDAPDPTSAPDPTPEPAQDDGISTFGSAYTYPDGLEVSVSEPQPFTPSSTAAGGSAHTDHISISITIVNGTSAAFDPTLTFATVQSANTEGDPVFDSGQGVGGSPNTTILPGRETTFTYAFGVDDPNDVIVEVTTDWNKDAAIFTDGSN